jgi:membrane-associated phospholipid phosphatase
MHKTETNRRKAGSMPVRERLPWLMLAAAAAAPVWKMTAAALSGGLSYGDIPVREFILQYRWPLLDQAMLLVSWLGSEYASPVILLTLLALMWRKERAVAITAVSVMASSTLWQIWLKAVVGRLRPDPVLYPVWQGAGFPSGHALTALVMAYLFWRLAHRFRWGHKITAGLGWAVILWPLVVGLSRIYLNAHYLSDVTGGYLLGIMHIALAFFLLGTGWLAPRSPTLPHQDQLVSGDGFTVS